MVNNLNVLEERINIRQDSVIINNGENDISFSVKTDTGTMIFSNAGLHRLGLGTSSPDSPININIDSEDVSNKGILHIEGTLDSTTNSLNALRVAPTISPSGASSNFFVACSYIPSSDSANIANARIVGTLGAPFIFGSADIKEVFGVQTKVQFDSTGTLTDGRGLFIESPSNSGTITTNYGLYIEGQTQGSTNFAILTNAGAVQIGDTVSIIGSQDIQQLIVKGNSTQTTNLVEFQDSSAGVLINIDGVGNLQLQNFHEIRFYDDGSNYVGFEAPALTGDQIWILPNADGNNLDVLTTDGAGTLTWTTNASEKSWTFTSPAGSSGIFYYGGFYLFGATDNDFNPSTTHGTANASYAAHFFLVQAAGGAGGTDTVIRITGTSITDDGVRTAADTEDLTVDDAGAANTYYETSKKWIGQVTIAKQSGPDLLCNYGFAKYWDNNNTNFRISGIEVTWFGGATDAGANIELIHHKNTGWTYNSGSTPTNPSAVVDMNTDHVTETSVINNENGAWKRSNLSTDIGGGASEGTIFKVTTGSNKAFELGNILLRIKPQP